MPEFNRLFILDTDASGDGLCPKLLMNILLFTPVGMTEQKGGTLHRDVILRHGGSRQS